MIKHTNIENVFINGYSIGFINKKKKKKTENHKPQYK